MKPLVALMVKNLPAIQETQVQSLGQGNPLEKKMATHCSILPWRIPCAEELVGCNPQGRKELDTTEAGQRLTEFFQEDALVIANTLFQQHKR